MTYPVREHRLKASIGIAADFRQRIARGELKAGDPLPVEADLIEELGASKGVVREALRILENEGFLEVRRGLGGGPRVRLPSIADAVSGVAVYLQIGDVQVGDVWEARDNLIANAVERLAAAPSVTSVRSLEASVTELAALVGDFDAYYGQMLDVGETAVTLAGRKTDAVLVAGLRHVIALELEAATRAIIESHRAQSIAAEELIVNAWREVVRSVKAGRPGAARRAFDRQAVSLRDAMSSKFGNISVVDAFKDAQDHDA